MLVPGREGTPQSIQDRVPSAEPAVWRFRRQFAVMDPHLNHRTNSDGFHPNRGDAAGTSVGEQEKRGRVILKGEGRTRGG